MIFEGRRDLLDGFRRGDKAALLEVYRHYVGDVAAFLRRGFTFDSKGRPCSFSGFRGGYEIEAALQEVFRRALEARARLAYNGIDPYRPYLLRIARNAVINDLKAKQPILFRFRAGAPVIIESGEHEPGPEDRPSDSRSAEELLEAKEVAGLIASFKASLEPRGRAVFEARFEEGLSADRAGAEIGLTRSQVRTTEAKIRKTFLAYMQRSGYLGAYSDKGRARVANGLMLALVGAL